MTSNRDSEEIRKLANDVALVSFPMRALGIDFRRNVTLLRLRDDRLVIHSTAPFRERDLAVIRSFGKPSWLVDATLMHDTFAKAARAVLPDLAYLTPAGFTEKTGIPTELLSTPPAEWT
jgi:hypothetical protein